MVERSAEGVRGRRRRGSESKVLVGQDAKRNKQVNQQK